MRFRSPTSRFRNKEGVLKNICESVAFILLNRNKGAKTVKRELLKLGPKIKDDVSWVEALYVAGNYVRHSEEWKVSPYERKNVNGQVHLVKIRKLKKLIKRQDTKINVRILEKMGFREWDILASGRDLTFDIVGRLGLHERDMLARKLHTWGVEVKDLMT